ncbi:WD40 repeat domain-containing protein [Phototrophicus methaneseepsis]|uniref:WD40 repeat domain-containing protein n=1 Tax=Phototrophicus methaneseepsis TaxID=2710758 RepID=A0A7S8E7C4_9CHLR|nr:WD40 repeat domain-containing protein [Phototrophicus methaneseepsis]QPC81692.1 WD40 repeat domain-containing protein [Phototrophicus methaneseepsis]
MTKLLVLLLFLLSILNPFMAQSSDDFEPITVDNIDNLQMTGIVSRGRLSSFAWSHDDAEIAVASPSGLWIYTPFNFDTMPEHFDTRPISTVLYSSDGHYLAAGGTVSASQATCGGLYGENLLTVWNIQTAETVVESRTSTVNMLFVPNHDLLLTVNRENGLELWDLGTGERLVYSQYLIPEAASHSFGTDIVLAVSPDGEYFAATAVYGGSFPSTWSTRNQIDLFLSDANHFVFSTRETVENNRFEQVAVSITDDWITHTGRSTDGQFQARYDGSRLTIYDTDTNKELSALDAHPGSFSTLTFHPNGDELAFLMYANEIRLWDIENLELRGVLEADAIISNTNILYSPNGQFLASGTSNFENMIYVWDLVSGGRPATFEVENNYSVISPRLFSSDNRYLFAVASGSGDSPSIISMIDMVNQEVSVNLEVDQRIGAITLSNDDRSLAVFTQNRSMNNYEIQIWRVADLVSGNYIETRYEVNFALIDMSFVSNNKLIVERPINECATTVSLFDLDTGVETQLGDDANAMSLYSPALNLDRSLLAVAEPTGIRLWDLRTLQEIEYISVDNVVSVIFSQDGRSLLSVHGYSGANGEVHLWRVNPIEE